MKRQHGNHNKKVCDKLYLNLQEEYICNDWVITTSFYSAIHFIDHALFPCEFDGEIFNDINEAHKVIKKASKHATREILVNKLIPQHKSDYSFLVAESQSARYVNYSVNKVIADKAYRILESIIKSYDKDKSEIKK